MNLLLVVYFWASIIFSLSVSRLEFLYEVKLLNLTLCRISEANLSLDQLEDLICSCAWIKLYGVELSIHEVESSIDGPSVDRTQDLLFRRWPLSSPCSKCLVKTLNHAKE